MIWYDIIWYILTYIHTFWTSRGRFGEVHALYHWNVNSSVASSTSDGIYLMDVTPPPYPTPPQPNDKKSYVPAMFDYQRVDAIELFISTCAPLGQSGQVMSSYVKLFISFPIFFVTFWRLAERLSWEQPTGYVLRPAWVWSLVWLFLMEDTRVKCGQLLQLFMRKGMTVDQLWDLDKEHGDKQWDLGPPYFQTNLNHPCRTLQEKNNKWKMMKNETMISHQ